MKINDILTKLDEMFPLNCQESWDHSGLQLGNTYQDVKKILITLNVDETTIQQAIDSGTNLIISHHPFLFHAVQTIDTSTIFGKNIAQLLNHQICVYSMHTNYDALRMNRLLLEKIGCQMIEAVDNSGILCIGKMPEAIPFDDFLIRLKKTFSLTYLRWCGHDPKMVKKVSFCAGSGHDFMNQALAISDVYVTGDLNYSHAMDIILKSHGAVIDVPHFIEEAFKKDIYEKLSEWTDLDVLIADEKDYFHIR